MSSTWDCKDPDDPHDTSADTTNSTTTLMGPVQLPKMTLRWHRPHRLMAHDMVGLPRKDMDYLNVTISAGFYT